MVTATTTWAPLIEKHTIGYVPPEDRHGKTRDLFILWFGGNIAPLPIVTGALGARRVVLVPWTAINLIDFWLANRDTTSAASLPEHSSTTSSPHIQSQKKPQRCGFLLFEETPARRY